MRGVSAKSLMSNTPPLVLVTEGSDPTPLNWLRERATVEEVPVDDARFPQRLAIADGLIVRTYTRVTDAFLSGAPKLKVVGRGGVGLENIKQRYLHLLDKKVIVESGDTHFTIKLPVAYENRNY